MEVILVIFGAALICLGLIGSFVPILPGLPFSYAGLLILQLAQQPFTTTFLLIWVVIVAIVTIVDSLMPTLGAKKLGGSPSGILGSVIGLIIGIIFFPPIGFITGPIVGAFIGELITGQTQKKAMKVALGSFIGFMVSTGLKVVIAGIMGYYYFVSITV